MKFLEPASNTFGGEEFGEKVRNGFGQVFGFQTRNDAQTYVASFSLLKLLPFSPSVNRTPLLLDHLFAFGAVDLFIFIIHLLACLVWARLRLDEARAP